MVPISCFRSIDAVRTMSSVSVSSLVASMMAAGVRRGFYTTVGGHLTASHPVLEPMRALFAADEVDFDAHEAVFLEAHEECLLGAFLWRTRRGQGCGGIRMRSYNSAEAFLRDGLRLSAGMGRKSALAGLHWGGGKGIICTDSAVDRSRDILKRKSVLRAYGKFISSLRGCYVGAEDAGISVDDMDIIFQETRFLTCISSSFGGSGNPSVPTAAGIVVGMEGALEALGMGTLEGKTIAIQGCGNVGGPMIGFLFEKGVSRIIGSEVDDVRVQNLKRSYESYISGGRLKLVSDPEFAILEEEVDILSPCAFGGILNETSVPKIKAKIICGAANNQLLDPKTEYGMQNRGIIFCPDFVVNRMGIVNCANEQYGRVGDPGSTSDPLVSKHLGKEDPDSIFNIVKVVIETARVQGKTTAEVAETMAVTASEQLHPIHGHRSKLIINSLMESGWACQ